MWTSDACPEIGSVRNYLSSAAKFILAASIVLTSIDVLALDDREPLAPQFYMDQAAQISCNIIPGNPP